MGKIINHKKLKLRLVQPKLIGKEDSFFYEGEIAFIETEDKFYSLIATGDIRINLEEDEITNSNKEEKVGKYKLTDKKLKLLESQGKLEWINNNWFEVGTTNKKTGNTEYDIGIITYNYNSAINMLKDYAGKENM